MPARPARLAVIALFIGLAGCGGGGGGGGGGAFPLWPVADAPGTGAPVASKAVSGIAAIGAPVANAEVMVRCANGVTASGTTTSAGRWSVSLKEPTFPCLVAVSGGSLPAGTALHSLAVGEGRVNVTPLTDLVLAKAAQAAPSTLGNAGPGVLEALATQLQAAQDQLFAILTAAGYPATTIDLFTADFEPTAGDAYDDLLEQLSTSLADAGTSYAGLLELVASSGTSTELPSLPNTTTFKAADLAAMPQLNKASLSADAGILSMKLEAANHNDVGAFVGGGVGNKAVLQLPGFAGMKLRDFKRMEIDVRGDSHTQGLAPRLFYVNLTVDLNCDSSPLPENATLEALRTRRRVVVFDPFYPHTTQISSTEFTTVAFTPGTPGWRIVGAAVGALTSSQSNAQTLDQGFNENSYPDACIVDGATGDAGMFRNRTVESCATKAALLPSDAAACAAPYRGAVLALGDSVTVDASAWSVESIRVESNTSTGIRTQSFRFE